MDRTLILVKPDGVARRLVGRIVTRLEEKGLFIAALKSLRLDEKRARGMYSVHEGKPFYEPLVRYMTSGPIAAVVVEGKGAVEIVRGLCGPTFGSQRPRRHHPRRLRRLQPPQHRPCVRFAGVLQARVPLLLLRRRDSLRRPVGV